jgi:hypothetical protein
VIEERPHSTPASPGAVFGDAAFYRDRPSEPVDLQPRPDRTLSQLRHSVNALQDEIRACPEKCAALQPQLDKARADLAAFEKTLVTTTPE